MPSVTEQLAQEVVATQFSDIPTAAIARLTRLFIDAVGITYMGYEAVGQSMADYAVDIGGAPEALILGTNRRVSAELAAAVNAQTSRNTDFEDTGPGLHPGPLIVHTALAMAQRVGASGQQLLAAMAIGHDLNCRLFLNAKAGPDIHHANMVAAVISGRLLGLDQESMATAISLAWEFPIKTINYTQPKIAKRITAVGMGNLFAARAGIQAALMAQHGFESTPDELDQLGERYDLSALASPAERFGHAENNVFLKPWPTSHACHMALQLIQELVENNGLNDSDIKEIRIGLPNLYLMPHQNDAMPTNYWQAIYSVAWAVAMVVHGVPPGPAWFSNSRLSDPQYRVTSAKVSVLEHPPASLALQQLDFHRLEGWVEIDTTDTTLRGSKSMNDTYGSPSHPMPEPMFRDKFQRVVEPSLGRAPAASLYAALGSVSSLTDVRQLQPLLAPGSQLQ